MIRKKIIKNLSGSTQQIINRVINNNDSYDVAPNFWLDLAKDSDVISKVTSGDYVINDGTSDLSVSDGLYHIQKISGISDAADIVFDNTTAQLSGNPNNVQDAIVASTLIYCSHPQFQFIGNMNYDQYLFSGVHSYSFSDRRSGDVSSGYRYSNCAPLSCTLDGKVYDASASIRGIAVSTGSVASTVRVKFELWKVGFSSEGSKLGDIVFDVNSTSHTIGVYWDSSGVAGYAGGQTQTPITVSRGDLLALKFIRQYGNNVAVSIENITVILGMRGI